jgi:hypothetical protein
MISVTDFLKIFTKEQILTYLIRINILILMKMTLKLIICNIWL